MHEDIEFSDTPVSEGIAYNDLGRIESYVLSFEGTALEVTREAGMIVFDDGTLRMRVPLPIIEAMMRLDLAALVPMATEAKEEE